MDEVINKHHKYISDLKIRITIFVSLIMILGGIAGLFIINNQNARISTIVITFLGFINLSLVYYKKYDMAMDVIIYGITVNIFSLTYLTGAAVVFMFVSIIIIISFIFEKVNTANVIFASSILFMIYLIAIGKLTLYTTYIEQYDANLGNNAQTLIILIPLSYGIGFLMKKTFIHTIQLQRLQYQQLVSMQQKLISQAELRSISMLAGGIAHDFNNIMSILLGYINIHKSDSRLPKETSEAFVKMELATLNAVNISNQIFALVKEDHDTKLEIKNMNNIIETTTDFTLKGSSIMPIFQLQDERSIDT